VVIDKCDTQTAGLVSSEFPHVKLVESSGGLSQARNDGFAESNGSIIAYLDDDVIVPNYWIRSIFRGIIQYPSAEVLGGPVVLPNDFELPWWMPKNKPGLPLVDYGEQSHFIDFPEQKLIGANIAFRREFLERVGVFPTDIGRKYHNLWGGEERFVQFLANRIVYLPQMKVYHKIPKNRFKIANIINYYILVGRADARHFASGTAKMAYEGRPVKNFLISGINKIWDMRLSTELSSFLMVLFWIFYAIGYVYERTVNKLCVY